MSGTRSTDVDGEAEYLAGIVARVDEFDVSRREERTRLQKVIYLLAAFGVDLGYDFRWYVDGVAAGDLAEVIDDFPDDTGSIEPTRFRDVEYRDRFERFLEFVEPVVDDSRQLEFSADLHWLARANDGLHRDLLIRFCRDRKAAADGERTSADLDGEYERAWDRLAEYGVVG